MLYNRASGISFCLHFYYNRINYQSQIVRQDFFVCNSQMYNSTGCNDIHLLFYFIGYAYTTIF